METVLNHLKAHPIQVSHEFKFLKDKSGNLLFSPKDWKTAQAISNFFSRCENYDVIQFTVTHEVLTVLERDQSMQLKVA